MDLGGQGNKFQNNKDFGGWGKDLSIVTRLSSFFMTLAYEERDVHFVKICWCFQSLRMESAFQSWANKSGLDSYDQILGNLTGPVMIRDEIWSTLSLQALLKESHYFPQQLNVLSLIQIHTAGNNCLK